MTLISYISQANLGSIQLILPKSKSSKKEKEDEEKGKGMRHAIRDGGGSQGDPETQIKT